jgi:hypothetical protein
MGKLKSLIAGTLLGAGGMYLGLQYHLLHADEGFLVVPRMPQQRLQDTYADVRDWDAATWTARPQLALAVTQYGRGDLISDGVKTKVLDNLRDSIAPLQQRLNEASGGWEPATTTRAPAPDEPKSQQTPPRRGYLPLAELFGINEQMLSSSSSGHSADDSSITPVLPTGVSTPKQVEILPSPGEFELLPEPDEVQLGPSAPIPGSKHSMDRRRSDATGGWQPLRVKPF